MVLLTNMRMQNLFLVRSGPGFNEGRDYLSKYFRQIFEESVSVKILSRQILRYTVFGIDSKGTIHQNVR